MNAITRTEFPEISFSEAVEILEKIRDKNIKTIEALAKELGYTGKSHGGVFFYKRSALTKHYGLLEPSKTSVVLTRLGERIIHPLSDADRSAALYEAVSRVALLKALFSELGTDYHQDDFKPKLATLTGASPSELAAVAKRVEMVYRAAIPILKQTPPESPDLFDSSNLPVLRVERVDKPEVRPPPGVRLTSPTIPTFDRPVRNLHSEDGYFIRVVLEVGVIEEAIAVLTALRNRVAHLPGTTGSTSDGTPSEAKT